MTPNNKNFDTFYFLSSLSLFIYSSLAKIDHKQSVIEIITDVEKIPILLEFLKLDEQMRFSQLLDIFASPSIHLTEKFEINYILVNPISRVLIKSLVPNNLMLKSVSSFFSSAGWLEREVWDLFGIYFENNTDLRRIVTDYGFEGFPLRKDFPVTGYYEIRYDDTQKCIIVQPVKFTQEFRTFSFTSPWENLYEL